MDSSFFIINKVSLPVGLWGSKRGEEQVNVCSYTDLFFEASLCRLYPVGVHYLFW